MALVEWLAGRSCAIDAEAWRGAAYAGSRGLPQWLADHGCDMPGEGAETGNVDEKQSKGTSS